MFSSSVVQEAFSPTSTTPIDNTDVTTSEDDLSELPDPLQASSVWGIDLYVSTLEIFLNCDSTSAEESP